MSLVTVYLVLAGALMFGACLFAAKKAYPDLHAKQFAIIALIVPLIVTLIWMLLSFATKERDEAPLVPPTQPTPLLQPSPD